MERIELNNNEIGRVQSVLSDYLNDHNSGLVNYEGDFVLDNKECVYLIIEGWYKKDEHFLQGQMREVAELDCETFFVTHEEIESYQDTSLISFSENQTYDHLGSGNYI